MAVEVKMFKAAEPNHRFNKNQKVWVIDDRGYHLHVVARWRGSGRYVFAVMRKYNTSYNKPHKCIGNFKRIKTIEVNDDFYKFLLSRL